MATIAPVSGVTTAVATTLSVTTHATCSWVAPSAPCSCGRATFTMVIVSEYSMALNAMMTSTSIR